MGHAFTYPILDVLARKKRMKGFNVLQPMGWDAFGLPTENYAIKTGIHPAIVTKRNTDRFRQQMKRLALAYDWDREVNTTDPSYYRWTQWIFIQLFKHDLAYKKKMPINWCPSCKIGLANEEVVAGKCERCGAAVGRKELSQWLLRITAYADRLADELDLVDYPDYVKAAQRNWIGRKEWIDIVYPIKGTKGTITVSTTRPDTNFGATFIVLAPEHPLISDILKGKFKVKKSRLKEIKEYVKKAKSKTDFERIAEGREKTGVFTGLYCLNQLNDYPMPIYVTDFVMMTVGTGAVVGVPGHDIRDFEFAQKFNLKVIRVVVGSDGDTSPITKKEQVQEKEGTMINSEFLNGMDIHQATKTIMDYIEKKGWGKRAIRYHLRDWIFSRQHYWGEPIPMIYCPACAEKGITWWDTREGKTFLKKHQTSSIKSQTNLKSQIENSSQRPVGWFPLSEEDLPLELPKVKKYEPTGTGESPLAAIRDWVEVACPECGGAARRETDTMPNWAGSSWYFLRYCDPSNNKSLADPKKMKYWMPVDIYLGGAEHTTLHLLYSRFWHKFLNDIGVVPGKEPYQARRQHGVILGEDGYRMSKSRGNIINPEEMMEKYGVDALRLYLMFMGPYDQTMPWSTKGIEGCYRFLKRVWRLYFQSEKIGKKSNKLLICLLHQLIKKVSEDIDRLSHNTAIAGMMEFVNNWTKLGQLSKKDAGIFLVLLAPYAPYISEELWREVLKKKMSIHRQKWPKYDLLLAKEKVVTIVVQVNGKLRDRLEVRVQKSKTKSEIEKLAKMSKKVQKYLKNKEVKKVIFIPGRLINFVAS
jgi:leucyl-tRNA synthetase